MLGFAKRPEDADEPLNWMKYIRVWTEAGLLLNFAVSTTQAEDDSTSQSGNLHEEKIRPQRILAG